jgi:hypothetical protein
MRIETWKKHFQIQTTEKFMLKSKRFYGLIVLAWFAFAACKKVSTLQGERNADGTAQVVNDGSSPLQIGGDGNTAGMNRATLPCLVGRPIREQFPPFSNDVFPAVSAAGIPMSPLDPKEFDMSAADDSDNPADIGSYNREYSLKNLTPGTQAVMNNLNNDLDKIANDPALNNTLDQEPFLRATEEAFTKAERSAASIKDDSPEGVKATVDCIRGTKAMVRPTYAHYLKQACDFNETDGTDVTAARFWKKLGRAVLRVAAAVVTTAVIVAAVVVVAKLTGGAALPVAVKLAGKALVAGIKIGGFKLAPALATGAAAGIKNADKNWNNKWKGASEFIFGIKLKW